MDWKAAPISAPPSNASADTSLVPLWATKQGYGRGLRALGRLVKYSRAVHGDGATRARGSHAQGAIADALSGLSDLMLARPDITNIDANPAFVYPNGLTVADARIVLKP